MGELVEMNRATLYRETMSGFVAIRVKHLRVREGVEYAQFRGAVSVDYVVKGKRKTTGFIVTRGPGFAVIEGWGAPVDVPSSMEGEGSCLVSRYPMCSPEWRREFDAWVSERGLSFSLDHLDPVATDDRWSSRAS